jgi:hypothetical protein
MTEDVLTGIITEYFSAGWRIAPFIKTTDGYIGVKAWPKRAASNAADLQLLIDEHAQKSSKTPILGIVPNKGMYVVDIDTKKNVSALQLWKDKVHEAYGTAELAVPNLVVKTKSGGYHLYYSDGTDRQLHSPTSVFSKDSGIDIRGFTGMVVAPTSIGTADDWVAGEYIVIKGRPSDEKTVLQLSKILGDSYDEADVFIRDLLRKVNEVVRNDCVNELNRHLLLPDDLIIPSSSRDNTLYRCARLCRLAGLSQEAALQFMRHIGMRCEATPEEPTEHWVSLAADKVRRVYASESEMRIQSISSFYDEMDNAGTVLLRGISKSYYYFRHGSTLLNIAPRDKYSTDNIGNVLQGIVIKSEDGEIPVKKVVGSYIPKEVAYSDAMYPRGGMPYFEFENRRYVNTYHDPFAGFEPSPELMHEALPYVEKFSQFVKHVTGYEDGDDAHLLDKLAWIVQKPYRRLPTATIIYSHTRGSGKDVFMGLVREIIGPRYYMPITLQSIESPHLMLHDKLICAASEVQLQTNARGNIAAATFMGKLKDIITRKTVYVDEKFIQAYSAPIFTNFFLLSNFELSAVLEPGDRRMDVFHAAEEKMDQSLFGPLADITNDGIWIERSERDRVLRRHIIFAIRRALMDRRVDQHFDRNEAVTNQVKLALLEGQNPPAIEWMMNHLPTYFTEDVAMMACYFCPLRTSPEYIMKQMREHLGPEMKPLYRSGRVIHRMNSAPLLQMRSDGGGKVPMLYFDTKSADTTARKPVYYFDRSTRDTNPSDATMRMLMRQWYSDMMQKFHGNTAVLPGMKPDGPPVADLV